jgi:2-(acetamidomethylene)succinate hydrolase
MTESSAISERSTSSRPRALCLHGITANAHVFEPMAELLAARFRIVSIDQRGHGRAAKPASGYAAADYARDIGEMLHEKTVLIGHSLGARNALVAGVRYPEKVAAVVAIDFTPYIEPEVFDALDARVAGGERTFDSFREICSYLQARYPRLPSDAIERRARHGYECVDGKWRPLALPAAMRETCKGLREDLSPVLKDIHVPVLLLRGAESKLVSREAWAKTRALRPEIPAQEIADADHYVHEEHPAAVAAAVLDFWDSIERRLQ